MKVFLGNAPWRSKDRLGVRAGSRWPMTLERGPYGNKVPVYLPFPFYLAYSAAVLGNLGHEVLLVDAIAEGISEKEFVRRVDEFGPSLVLLETSTPTINRDLEVVRRIRETRGDLSKLAVSGPHVTYMGEKFLNENKDIDFILQGEYEYTLRDLIQALDGGAGDSSLAAVDGLIYRESSGAAKGNPRRPAIENLDELPWPAYKYLPMYNYNDDCFGLEKPNVQMWASRGCPYNCVFCMWPDIMYGGHKYRTRDPIKVVDEMEWLLENYGFRGFYFDDDTFNIGKERMLKLCSEIKSRRLDTGWAAMARADTSDRETLAAMVDAGMVAIKLGVESAEQSLVDSCGKGLDLAKVEESIRNARELGLRVHLTFTFGLPGETHESIQRTIDYAVSQDVFSVQFSIATPFPGTKLFKNLDAEGRILSKNWDDYDGNRKSVSRSENLSDKDLSDALERAKCAWDSRKATSKIPEEALLLIGK
ncbi:B12-binding domain-containing radical SAM protein [Candidatus Hydrogenedentota bacterium]